MLGHAAVLEHTVVLEHSVAVSAGAYRGTGAHCGTGANRGCQFCGCQCWSTLQDPSLQVPNAPLAGAAARHRICKTGVCLTVWLWWWTVQEGLIDRLTVETSTFLDELRSRKYTKVGQRDCTSAHTLVCPWGAGLAPLHAACMDRIGHGCHGAMVAIVHIARGCAAQGMRAEPPTASVACVRLEMIMSR